MNKLQPNNLFALLGSFWTRVFTSAALLKQLFRGQLSIHSQSEQSVTELVQSVGNAEIPPGAKTTWHKIVLGIYNQTKVLYGDPTSKYGSSFFYGQVDNNRAAYDIDSDILSIPFLYDNPYNPTKVLTEGIDYKISNSQLIFRSALNFTGEPVTFYARMMVRESGFTTSRLGYAIGVYLSDQTYKKVPFKYVWRMSSYGPNYQDFLNILGSCSGAPIANQDETVEFVQADKAVTLIVTNTSAYATSTAKSISLAVGQIIPQGTPLSKGLQILHDKELYINEAIPQVYRDNNIFKYGNDLAYGHSLIIIKADITGPAAAALKTFKNTLPLDVKVLIYTNIDLPTVTVTNQAVSFVLDYYAKDSTTNSEYRVIKNAAASTVVRVPDLSINNAQMSLKASAKVKYTLYGY